MEISICVSNDKINSFDINSSSCRFKQLGRFMIHPKRVCVSRSSSHLHARVHAEGARGWEVVRCIAGKQHTALAIAAS